MSVALSTESVVLLAVMAVTGLFLVWLGRYVRRTQDLQLVAGVRDGESVSDVAGLTALVGNVTVLTGFGTVLAGLVSLLVPAPERGLVWGGYIVGTLALAGWAHWRSSEYTE